MWKGSSVMAAQNMGAGEIKRAKHSFYIGLLLALIFAVPSFLLMWICPEKLMALTSSDNEIILSGGDFMLAYSPDCLLMALVFCLTGQNNNLHGFCGVPLTAINTCEVILGQNSVIDKLKIED